MNTLIIITGAVFALYFLGSVLITAGDRGVNNGIELSGLIFKALAFAWSIVLVVLGISHC